MTDKMKISILIYDKEYSVTMSSDSTLVEFMEEFKNLSKTIYSEKLVEKYWNEIN